MGVLVTASMLLNQGVVIAVDVVAAIVDVNVVKMQVVVAAKVRVVV